MQRLRQGDAEHMEQQRMAQERRHQVFVSSTYVDLVSERQHVMQTLLALDCIPAGMELFPASSEEQWSLIRSVIEESDYYIVISAGKYGSLSPTGVSYTEREYDYAIEQEKPILAFLHEDIFNLPAKLVESKEVNKSKLDAFHAKIRNRLCKFWTSAPELVGHVATSMAHARKRFPSPGWIRGDQPSNEELLTQINDLTRERDDLRKKLAESTSEPPEGYSELASGTESYKITYHIPKMSRNGRNIRSNIEVTWDRIFGILGPLLIDECEDSEMFEFLKNTIYHKIKKKHTKKFLQNHLALNSHSVNQIRIQLRALGLIQKSPKRHPVSDTKSYWSLTPYGEQRLTAISAIKSDQSSESTDNHG